MGLLFRLLKYLFKFFNDSFESINTKNKDSKLRSKVVNANNLKIEDLNKKEAEKKLKDLSKLFGEVLDRDHEFYKKYIKDKPKEPNVFTDMLHAASTRYLNFHDPIFNKRAMNICHVQELYGLTFQLGILFYKVINFDQEKL
jgi:hypothetical protein